MKRRLLHTAQRFDCFFNEIIHDHLDKRKTDVGVAKESKDLIDVLLDLKENRSCELLLTLDNIKAIILDMFAAGTDTTFITLDWGMTELMRNPRVMKKAKDEVRNIVGERPYVTEDDLQRADYLKLVIKEIFRLHPAAPVLLPRESMEETNIDGYTIPSKTRIYVNAWAIGRDPTTWERAEEFEPERFANKAIDFKGQHFELIPFGAGRRMCPAVEFAMASIELVLAQLLHSFDWELPEGVTSENLDLNEVFGITMVKASQLYVIAKPRFEL